MTDLASLVQALPGELYNKIYDLTFTFDDIYNIDRNYKPPSSLQVNRATRNAHMKIYYRSIFHVGMENLIKWLASLTCGQARTLTDVLLTDSKNWSEKSIEDMWSLAGHYVMGLSQDYGDYTGVASIKLGNMLHSALKFHACGTGDMKSGWWSYNDLDREV